MTIQQKVQDRNIQYLYHFTYVDNLASIIENGLISRVDLDDEEINYDYNDNDRIDGHLDAICLSISYPNAKMFYKYRGLKPGDWVLLAISPAVLWEKDCAFYPTNAASNNVRFNDPSLLKSVEAMEAMFSENVFSEIRGENLTSEYTTDVQAEVLVFEEIEPAYILEVIHPNKKSAEDFFVSHSTTKHTYYDTLNCKTLFSQRHYFLG